MQYTLPELPYALNALEPHMSRETLEYHYGKHHKTYVDTLNKLIQGSEFADKSLEDIIRTSSGNIFNNSAQVWNHTFFWNCLSPHGGGEPTGNLKTMLEKEFGSIAQFKEEFTKAALTRFGSGWAWLIREADGKLKVISTSNADTPLAHNQTALLTCDVWEHAYYIDYRNRRPDYVAAFWELVNWDFVNQNLG